jgi:hypothetical protein
MVTAELEAEYVRRGIGLVGVDEGLAALLDLATDPSPPAQTVVMRATPDAFGSGVA